MASNVDTTVPTEGAATTASVRTNFSTIKTEIEALQDTSVTTSGTATLTNKTIDLGSNTLTGTAAQFNTALTDTDFSTSSGTETLTNKTIDLTNNTLTGTAAEFNTALSDGSFATLAGTETLTNKTITAAGNTLDATLEDIAGLAVTDSGFIVGDGSNFVLETGATVRTSLGLGTMAVEATNAVPAMTYAGTQSYADNILDQPVIRDYGETVNALGDLGGGTDDIDLESGNVVTATVSTATQTFTFSNPPASGTAGSFTLILTNGGSQTVNWPASVDWAGGTAPTLTSSGVDVLTFITTDGGTTWYGFAAGLAMA